MARSLIFGWLQASWVIGVVTVWGWGGAVSQAGAASPRAVEPKTFVRAIAPVAPESGAILPRLVAQQDITILPGERVGAVTKTTSRADLARMFGETALQDTQIPVGEGYAEAGTIVNGGTDQAFSVIWLDSARTQPAIVKDFGPAWKTPEGIHVGMAWEEVRAILGSFKIYGFGWDYGGTVVLEESNLSQYYGLMILRLDTTAAAAQQHPDAYQAVSGDGLFSSDDPNFQTLNPTVEQMIIYLNSLL